MAHRIRAAMTDENPAPLGGEGKMVEADETFHGKVATPPDRKKPIRNRSGPADKRAVVALVERRGQVRAVHLPKVVAKDVGEVLARCADPKSRLHTDESNLYLSHAGKFASHETVRHTAGEYAHGDENTNSVEGYFSTFKRGMTGVYQHCGEQHLQRYLNEFSFRLCQNKGHFLS
jgi:hypothetical protein